MALTTRVIARGSFSSWAGSTRPSPGTLAVKIGLNATVGLPGDGRVEPGQDGWRRMRAKCVSPTRQHHLASSPLIGDMNALGGR